MKTVTVTRPNSVQLMSQLWTPLPEFQQELLNGGAPKVSISISTIAGSVSLSSTPAIVK